MTSLADTMGTTTASVAPAVLLMLQPMLVLMEATIQVLPIRELSQLRVTRQQDLQVALAPMLVAKYENKIT